jgi:hypothetical protein
VGTACARALRLTPEAFLGAGLPLPFRPHLSGINVALIHIVPVVTEIFSLFFFRLVFVFGKIVLRLVFVSWGIIVAIIVVTFSIRTIAPFFFDPLVSGHSVTHTTPVPNRAAVHEMQQPRRQKRSNVHFVRPLFSVGELETLEQA